MSKYLDSGGLTHFWEKIKVKLGNKVDKVTGKSLISDKEITRLSTIENYDDTEIRNMISMSTSTGVVVYVDGTNGNDDNDGSTKTKAFKTLKKAIQLLNKTNNLGIYCAAGIYDITSNGYISTTLTRGKTLHLTNYNRTIDNISDVTIRGCIRSYLGCSLMCTYVTLESVETTSWENAYASMYYIGEMAQAYIDHCIINNNHYESTIAVSSSRLIIMNVMINNNSTKTNKYSLRVANSIVHINNLTDDTATADVYYNYRYPSLIMSDRTLTSRGTNNGLTVVNGQIQG